MSGRKALMRPSARAEMERAQDKALDRVWNKVTADSLKVAAGLFEPPLLEDGTPNPAYNPDAAATKAQCSMRTWAALQILKDQRADKREDRADQRAFGSIVLQKKLSEDEWSQMAQRMGKLRQERTPNAPVIDVKVKGDDGAE